MGDAESRYKTNEKVYCLFHSHQLEVAHSRRSLILLRCDSSNCNTHKHLVQHQHAGDTRGDRASLVILAELLGAVVISGDSFRTSSDQ